MIVTEHNLIDAEYTTRCLACGEILRTVTEEALCRSRTTPEQEEQATYLLSFTHKCPKDP